MDWPVLVWCGHDFERRKKKGTHHLQKQVGQRSDPAPGDGGYTVAVNFWYDMAYGSRYCHYEASSRLLGTS